MRVEAAPRYAGQSGLSTRFVTSLPHFAARQSLQTPISDPGQPRPFQRVSPSFPFESDPLRSPHTRITRFPGPILQRISNLKRMADASTDDAVHPEREVLLPWRVSLGRGFYPLLRPPSHSVCPGPSVVASALLRFRGSRRTRPCQKPRLAFGQPGSSPPKPVTQPRS